MSYLGDTFAGRPMSYLGDTFAGRPMSYLGDTFAGRPMSYLYGIFTHHQPDGDGIILSQNEKWIHQRRFALRIFRDFGMGKKLMETKIDYHTDKLIEYIRQQIHRNAVK
uniref:Cytochrome P450 n=1 Tax=Ascaris lumbricoides TaxID=6252 RepID=A0A0M3ISU9_ASCLU